jgi:hypothetical protein
MYKHKDDAMFDSKKVVFTLYLQVRRQLQGRRQVSVNGKSRGAHLQRQAC